MLTVEGYFKPEDRSNKDGVNRQHVILITTKFYTRQEPKREGQLSLPFTLLH